MYLTSVRFCIYFLSVFNFVYDCAIPFSPQRLELFHKYATNAMCKAGIPVLEVYPMTASYPNGTLDHVHYSANAQRAAEDQLLAFIVEKLEDKPT